MDTLKTCRDCQKAKPLSEFTPRNISIGYYNAYCKPCNSLRTVRSNKLHAEKRREYNRQYRKKNLEKVKEYDKRGREKWKEKNLDYYKIRHSQNKDYYNELCRKWYHANKDKARACQKQYRTKLRQLPPELKETIKILNQLKKAIKEYGKE